MRPSKEIRQVSAGLISSDPRVDVASRVDEGGHEWREGSTNSQSIADMKSGRQCKKRARDPPSQKSLRSPAMMVSIEDLYLLVHDIRLVPYLEKN